MKRELALALGLLLCDGPLRAAQPLVLAVARTALSSPLLVAEALRMFEAEGVEVRLDEEAGGYRCLAAVLEGRADAGTVPDLPLSLTSFERDDFAILATFVSDAADVKLLVRTDRGIGAVEDLPGRRVGTVLGTSSHIFLDDVLLHGIDPAEVHTEDHAPASLRRVLMDGTLDAVALREPGAWELLRAADGGADELAVPPTLRQTFNLVGSADAVARDGTALEFVLRALQRALEYMREEPAASMDIVARRLGVERGFVEWGWPRLHFDLALGQALLATLEHEARRALRRGFVHAAPVPDCLGLLEAAPLRRVRADAVTLVD